VRVVVISSHHRLGRRYAIPRKVDVDDGVIDDGVIDANDGR
jgi:hypothetical protein